jgi:putative oxidoreductase
MRNGWLTTHKDVPSPAAKIGHILVFDRLGILYARIALGAAFLSAVADRFGLWGKYGAWGNFANFEQYTAQVNSFMPGFMIPFLAWAATAAELSLGITLILGIWTRWVALGAASLLFLFATAMAISFGIKSPLDYSVFSASAGALCFRSFRRKGIGSKMGKYRWETGPTILDNRSISRRRH